MNDEVASFLYRQVDDREREALYQNLVAEPATRIDTGRLATIAAQCVAEILLAPTDRSLWFQRMLSTGTTCLLGGNVVENHADGGTAYGLTYPGQVVRLGLEDIVGTDALEVCEVCERRLRVVHRLELPEAAGADVDAALLGTG